MRFRTAPFSIGCRENVAAADEKAPLPFGAQGESSINAGPTMIWDGRLATPSDGTVIGIRFD